MSSWSRSVMQRELAVSKECADCSLFGCLLSYLVHVQVLLKLGIHDVLEGLVVHASDVSDRNNVCEDHNESIK